MNGIDIRTLLANNLDKLREASASLKSNVEIAKRGGPSNGTLGRIALKQQRVSLEIMCSLAKVFGLQPWQILVPGIEAKSNGTNHPTISGLPGWPFPKVPQKRYEDLSPDDQAFIQGRIMSDIEHIEGNRPRRKLRLVAESTLSEKQPENSP